VTKSIILDQIVDGYGNKAVDVLKKTMAGAWDALSDEDKAAVKKLAFTMAKAHILETAGYDVSDYIGTLNSAMLQWKFVGQQVTINAFRTAAHEVFGVAGAFAGSALAAFVKSVL
jgi:hypothetical protein